jgi:hypothetical protein
MCAKGEEKPGSRSYYFDPAVKCCTYVPRLHNFLVGRILSDNDPLAGPGRATVENRLRQRVAVTPLGLGLPAVFTLLYDQSRGAFGRSRSLRCPHYIEEGGRCGIWRNRNSTCATWFCKHVRGKVGQTFWKDSLHHLLRVVERDLARWCVLEIELDDDALRHLVADPSWAGGVETVTGESIDNRVEEESYARFWGGWRGREADFFIRCAELVSPLSWNDVLAISGPEARACAHLTRQAYGRLISDEIPAALIVGEMEIVQMQHETARINTYNAYDPLDVPGVVIALLHCFDGRPTQEAVASIADQTGIQLDISLIRKMVDFGLLVEPPSERQASHVEAAFPEAPPDA